MDWTVTSYAVTAGGLGYRFGRRLARSVSVRRQSRRLIQPELAGVLLPWPLAGDQRGAQFQRHYGDGETLVDGGHIASAANATNNMQIAIYGGVLTGSTSTVATLTLGVGGVSDFLWMQAG